MAAAQQAALADCKQYIEWATDEWSLIEARELLHFSGPGVHPLLMARFGRRIAFGTAGLRAVMASGFASMNPLVIRQTCQGLCRYAQTHMPNFATRGVVIGFDGRHHSQEFADIAASVFGGEGVVVHWYQKMIPTPFVPFGVVELKAAIGIMITASHNPKQDNGFKVYWANGAQIIPPQDAGIAAAILDNLVPWPSHQLDRKEIEARDPTRMLWGRYFSRIASFPYCMTPLLNPRTTLRIVYTAMHGVGRDAAVAAFESFKLPAFVQVAEQCTPDPDFPTVAFPNPEEGAGALALSFKTALASKCTLILANDPDADRLAVAELQSDSTWRIFNGNEIAALFADWIWINYVKSQPDADHSQAFMVASCVSSKFLRAMAAKEGFIFTDTLTGFKWLGNAVLGMEASGMHFLFAYEVEIGFLAGNMSYDKDGVRMAAMFAEMASSLHSRGTNCSAHLSSLYERYGHFSMTATYFFCHERDLLDTVFERLRTGGKQGGYITEADGHAIRYVRDVTRGFDSSQADGRPLLPVMPNDQMIIFEFENGTLATLRNSGTEPKLKYYVECTGSTRAAADELRRTMTRAVIDAMIRPQDHPQLKAP